MAHSFILGGTKGLGLAIARESYRRGLEPIIAGRSVTGGLVTGIAADELPPKHIGLRVDLSRPSPWPFVPVLATLDIDYFFWVAGIALTKPFVSTSDEELTAMVNTHLASPVRFIRDFYRARIQDGHPCHLVTVASTSSWRLREDEAVYCAVKAAKAAFTRNFSRELARDLPGSRTILVNPGGIRTPNFWRDDPRDISKFMDPDAVAGIIWDELRGPGSPTFREMQIIRQDDGSPRVEYGPRTPEMPS